MYIYCTVQCLLKKIAYEWTRAIQTGIIQRSALFFLGHRHFIGPLKAGASMCWAYSLRNELLGPLPGSGQAQNVAL